MDIKVIFDETISLTTTNVEEISIFERDEATLVLDN